MILNKYVEEYISDYREGKIVLNKERIQLIDILEKYVFPRDDIYFNDDLIEKCIKFGEKYYFKLQPFQKFIIAFVFLLYKKNDKAYYRRFLIMMGRGGGKNGLISVLTNFLISSLHGIPDYNISIVANSEEQAKTSFNESYNAITRNQRMVKSFKCTLEQIQNLKTRSILKFRTSNASTKDGLRDGAVVYDEIHQYENNNTVRVFSSGLGKKKNPREFFITTDGYVRDGFLDKQKAKASKILSGESPNSNMFIFICKLDDYEEIDNPDVWEKANPMFSNPRGEYADNLFDVIFDEYRDLEDEPEGREEFITKRMNLPETDLTKSVATDEEIFATNRPMPNVKHRTCIGGLDFGSIRDFTAVGCLFKIDGDYVWKTHSFARKEYLDKAKLKPPIREWEKQGLLTVVDEPSINPEHVVNWFVEMRKEHGLETIVADNYKLDLLRPLLEKQGFEVVCIRNPKAIHPLLIPRIESAFANRQIIWGDNPLMRWYTFNVYVNIKKDGNKVYEKKDEHRRKTDGFQAFVHAMYKAGELLNDEVDFFLNNLEF